MGGITQAKHKSSKQEPLSMVPLRRREILAVNMAGAAKHVHGLRLECDDHLNVHNLPRLHSMERKLQVLEDSFALKPKIASL